MKNRTRTFAIAVIAVACAVSVAAADKGGKGKGHGHGGDSGHGNEKSKHGKGHFESRDREAIQRYYRDEYGRSGSCPPGLAKKDNGCMPPGQARRWSAGSHIPADYAIAPLPSVLRVGLVPPPPGYEYGYADGAVLLFVPATRIVIDVVVPF